MIDVEVGPLWLDKDDGCWRWLIKIEMIEGGVCHYGRGIISTFEVV